jgi:hypothetical protein
MDALCKIEQFVKIHYTKILSRSVLISNRFNKVKQTGGFLVQG